MKKILFISPSCYPIYGSEASCNIKFLYVLSQLDCQIDLITGKSYVYYPFNKNDSSYLKNINKIVSVKRNNKINLHSIFEYIRTFIKTGYVYSGIAGTFEMISVAETLIKENAYDYIFTKDYPSEVVGLYLSKKYKIRWVPTFNDPYCMDKFPEPYGKGYQCRVGWIREKLIKDISKTAYMSIYPSSRLRDYMLKYMYGMKMENTLIIPHILIKEKIIYQDAAPKKKLRVLYSGIITSERVTESFFKGFGNFCEKRTPNLILTFRGIIDKNAQKEIDKYIVKYNIKEYIIFLPPVSFIESVEEAKEYDVCLVIEANCEEGIFLPGKVPNYLQCNTSIFAISPQNGILNDLYKTGIVDYFADVSSFTSVEFNFNILYNDYKKGGLIQRDKDLSPFLSTEIATKLNDIFIK